VARESLLFPVLALELAVVAMVNPRGNFPLNDDWMYATMVHSLVVDHVYIHHPFSNPIAVAHVAWGALFCLIFGFSYTMLRVSTLVLAMIGGWATAKSAVACGLSRGAGLLCAFIVLSNPIFVNLSYTFMTDIPFFVFLSLSILFYLRAFEEDRPKNVFLGSLFGALAFLVRQFGLSIAIGYVVVALLMKRKRSTLTTLRGMTVFAAPWLLSLVIFLVWKMTVTRDIPLPICFSSQSLSARFLGLSVYVVTMLAAMGLFLLPMTCIRIAPVFTLRERWPWYRFLWIGLFGLASAFLFTMVWKRPLPVPGNIFNRTGTGVLNFAGIYPTPESWEMPLQAGWWIATALAVVSGAIIVADALRTGLIEPLRRAFSTEESDGEDRGRSAQRFFLCLWVLFVFAMSYSPLVRFVFDRYTLPVLLPLPILYLGRVRLRTGIVSRGVAILCGVLMLLFSVVGAHDYLALNEARWQGLTFLRNEMEVPPEYIDGGFEFNGQYTSRTFMEYYGIQDFWKCHRGVHWFVLDDTFTVSLTPIPGYQEIKRFPYFQWFGWRIQKDKGQRGISLIGMFFFVLCPLSLAHGCHFYLFPVPKDKIRRAKAS